MHLHLRRGALHLVAVEKARAKEVLRARKERPSSLKLNGFLKIYVMSLFDQTDLRASWTVVRR